jgi:undecaprenyl-diphosphatase
LHNRGPLVGLSKFIATWLDAAPLAVLSLLVSVLMFYWTRSVAAALPVVAYLGGEFQVFAIREIIHRPRPSTAIFPHPGAIASIHETSFSFPSGHAIAVTALLFAMLGYLALVKHTWWPYPVAVVVALFVADTRLVLGVHWLSDAGFGVLAGIAWGLTVAGVTHQLVLSPQTVARFGQRLVAPRI